MICVNIVEGHACEEFCFQNHNGLATANPLYLMLCIIIDKIYMHIDKIISYSSLL